MNTKPSPLYAAGVRAGRAWARRLAAFADLDALAADRGGLAACTSNYVRGFVDGALAVRAEVSEPPAPARLPLVRMKGGRP